MNQITTNELILILYLLISLGSVIGTYKANPKSNHEAGLPATIIVSVLIGLFWIIIIPMFKMSKMFKEIR